MSTLTLDSTDLTLHVQRSAPARLVVEPGTRLIGRAGAAWITINGQPCDIILEPGDVYEVASNAPLMITALQGATWSGCMLLPPSASPAGAPAKGSLWRSLAAQLTRATLGKQAHGGDAVSAGCGRLVARAERFANAS
ncbi:MAG: DUF2917 domain-containing protein [Burkholderiaceae bacterium]